MCSGRIEGTAEKEKNQKRSNEEVMHETALPLQGWRTGEVVQPTYCQKGEKKWVTNEQCGAGCKREGAEA